MKKYITFTFISLFFSINLFAGCMKGEIKQIDAKLENSSISEDKNEVMKLRKLVVANEHKNSELAFESYEKAMSIKLSLIEFITILYSYKLLIGLCVLLCLKIYYL